MLIGLTAATAILAGFEAVVRARARREPADRRQLRRALRSGAPRPAGRRDPRRRSRSSSRRRWSCSSRSRRGRQPQKASARSTCRSSARTSSSRSASSARTRSCAACSSRSASPILGGGAIIPVGFNYVQRQPHRRASRSPTGSRSLQQLTATPATFMLVFMALGMVIGALVVPRLEHVVKLQLLFAGSVAGVRPRDARLRERATTTGSPASSRSSPARASRRSRSPATATWCARPPTSCAAGSSRRWSRSSRSRCCSR